MKIIFLDIDGVLCIPIRSGADLYSGQSSYTFEEFDKRCVANLNTILESDENIKLVISSIWRYNMRKLVDRFQSYGIDVGRMVGSTEKNHTISRGHKILDWMDKYGMEEDTWCVIDDIDIPEVEDKLVQTKFDYDEGLKEEHILKVLTILDEKTIHPTNKSDSPKLDMLKDKRSRTFPKGSVPNIHKSL